ncbi:MAG: hypothetical protein ACLFNU_03510 [Bacteroidales bacterium]
MHRTINVLVLLILASLLKGCGKNETDCSSIERGVVTQVSGPQELEYPSEVSIDVSLYAINGCGSFYKIEESIDGDTIYIEMLVKYVGCICTQALVNIEREYIFRPPSRGTYSFVFLNKFADSITHEITVN